MESDKQKRVLDLSKLQFKIGELSRMTGVSTRQLRYWEKKAFIAAKQRQEEQDARVFGFDAYVKVSLVKHLMDEGYTLSAANDKSKTLIEDAKWAHHFARQAFHGIENVNGRRRLNLGFIDDAHEQVLYGVTNDEGKIHYEIHPAQSNQETSGN